MSGQIAIITSGRGGRSAISLPSIQTHFASDSGTLSWRPHRAQSKWILRAFHR